MKVRTLWVMHANEDDQPELVVAVDELTDGINPNLWGEKVGEVEKAYGKDQTYREVVLEVPFDDIVAAFAPPTLAANVAAVST